MWALQFTVFNFWIEALLLHYSDKIHFSWLTQQALLVFKSLFRFHVFLKKNLFFCYINNSNFMTHCCFLSFFFGALRIAAGGNLFYRVKNMRARITFTAKMRYRREKFTHAEGIQGWWKIHLLKNCNMFFISGSQISFGISHSMKSNSHWSNSQRQNFHPHWEHNKGQLK